MHFLLRLNEKGGMQKRGHTHDNDNCFSIQKYVHSVYRECGIFAANFRSQLFNYLVYISKLIYSLIY